MTGRAVLRAGVLVALVAALLALPVGAQENGDDTDRAAGGDAPVLRLVDDVPVRQGSPWYVGSAGDGYGDNNFTYTYVQGTSNSRGEVADGRSRARWDFSRVPSGSECRLEVYVPYRDATAEVYYHVFGDGADGREYVRSVRLDQSDHRHWVLLGTETLSGLVRVYVSNYEWRGLAPRIDERGHLYNRVAADALRLTCGDVTPLAAPEPLMVASAPRSAKVSWTAVDGAAGYLVTWRAAGGIDDAAVAVRGTGHTIEGLAAGVTYEVRVRALASGEGATTDGPFSIAVEVTPHAGPAPDPTGGPSTGGPSTGGPSTDDPSTDGPSTGGPSTGGPSTGGPSTGGPSTGGPGTDTPAPRPSPPRTGLVVDECFRNPHSATPGPSPSGIRAVAGDRQITVSWSAAPDALSYSLNWEVRGDEPFDVCLPGPNVGHTSTTSYTIRGLTNGQEYVVALWATPNTRTLNDSIPVATTATPSIALATPTIQADARNREIQVIWNRVANAGGYTVTWSPPHAGGTVNLGADALGYTITGLRNRTEYTFTVKATPATAAYRDSAGATVTATPQAGPLATPTSVTATAGPGSGEVTVSWDAVLHAQGYTITWQPPDAGGTANVGAVTQHTISGLTNTRTYSFTVKATSTSQDHGDSAESAAAGATPVAPRLPVPGNVQVSGVPLNAPGGGVHPDYPGLYVSWTAVAGADGYRINWHRPGFGNHGSGQVNDGAATTYTASIAGTGTWAARVTALSTGTDFRDSLSSAEVTLANYVG